MGRREEGEGGRRGEAGGGGGGRSGQDWGGVGRIGGGERRWEEGGMRNDEQFAEDAMNEERRTICGGRYE